MKNQFANLDAQNGEHRLATVTMEETLPSVAKQLKQARIYPDDIGDDDCRKIVYDVHEVGKHLPVAHGFSCAITANAWAIANGYEVLP